MKADEQLILRLEHNVEKTVLQIWGYARDYHQSLESEKHFRRLHEIIKPLTAKYQREVDAVLESREEVKRTCTKLRKANAELRQMLKQVEEQSGAKE